MTSSAVENEYYIPGRHVTQSAGGEQFLVRSPTSRPSDVIPLTISEPSNTSRMNSSGRRVTFHRVCCVIGKIVLLLTVSVVTVVITMVITNIVLNKANEKQYGELFGHKLKSYS